MRYCPGTHISDEYSTDVEDQILKERRQEEIDSADMKKGYFVVVKFASKSSLVHYIGQIMQQNGPDTMDADRKETKGNQKPLFK